MPIFFIQKPYLFLTANSQFQYRTPLIRVKNPTSIAPWPSRTFTPEAPLWTCVLKVEFILFFWMAGIGNGTGFSPAIHAFKTRYFALQGHVSLPRITSKGEGSKRSRRFFLGANTRQLVTPWIRGSGEGALFYESLPLLLLITLMVLVVWTEESIENTMHVPRSIEEMGGGSIVEAIFVIAVFQKYGLFNYNWVRHHSQTLHFIL